MPKDSALLSVHQTGEAGEEVLAEKGASAVDTFGGKVLVRWDPEAHVTGFGPAAYFIEFLKTNGLWESWVRDCPLQYKSANDRAVDKQGRTVDFLLSAKRKI